jgi:endonuclease/exonuclease/phosphatase family metal-dependent hydrolase
MHYLSRPCIFARIFLTLLVPAALAPALAQTTNQTIRVMSANITSGNSQQYETPGIDIFQGLKPDIVAIQEFNYGNNTQSDFDALVSLAFGPGFSWFREAGSSFTIPNGIISRYPITASGSWDDPVLGNRGFAWAKIALNSSNDLYVISVHLFSGGTDTDRNTEAQTIVNHINNDFPPGALVIVAGDFNTSSRSELALGTFGTVLSDNPVPTDAEVGGDPDTNSNRNHPYDYLLPSFSLTNRLTPVVLASHTFPNGLVFDSRVYTPLSDVPPVVASDSGAVNMQHMAVIKDFQISGVSTNTSTNTSPPHISGQPQNQAAIAGNNATFNVLASGAPTLDYQWRFNGTNIPGATATTYTRTNVQPADAGPYLVVVTNPFGSITSSPAVLSVLPTNSTTIAQWNFNSVVPDGSTTTGVLTPSFGSGSAAYVGGTGPNASGFAGGSSTDPNSTDNTAWNTTGYPALSANNKTAGVRFAISTAGWQKINVRWDQRPSGTGSRYVRLQYTTNGSVYVDFPTSVSVASTSFESKTNDLTGFSGVDDNLNFGFRLVTEFESSAINSANSNYVGATSGYAGSGTLRYDMVTVSGVIFVSNSPPTPAILGIPLLETNQTLSFSVTGAPGSNYIVQATTDFTNVSWTSLATNVSPFTFVVTNLDDFPQRYYRAVTQ